MGGDGRRPVLRESLHATLYLYHTRVMQNKGTHPLLRILSTSNGLTACGVKRSLVLAPVLKKVAHFEAVRSTRASIILSGTIPCTYTANSDRREHEIAKSLKGFRLLYAPPDAPTFQRRTPIFPVVTPNKRHAYITPLTTTYGPFLGKQSQTRFRSWRSSQTASSPAILPLRQTC